MTAVHHTAIVTADVERSMRFWRDGLGLTELFDHTFTGDWQTLFGAATDQLRSVFLGDPKAPDSGIVELVVFENSQSPPPRPERSGVRLLSALVAAGRRARIGAAGRTRDSTRASGAFETPPAPGGKTVAMAVVTAPDNVRVELIGPAV